MPSVLKRAANWLGLIDEERYADDPVDGPSEAGTDDHEGVEEAERLADVTPLPLRHDRQPEGYARGGAVYPLVITARSFEDAERIGDAYRSGVAVAVDLSEVPHGDARRVLDFDAGLIYALSGRLEKLAPKLFLMSPAGVVVSAEERRRILASVAKAA